MTPILTAEQIRLADEYTILNQSIASIELMERAAQSFHSAYMTLPQRKVIYIFCGNGNNGGDGLAFARIIEGYGSFQIRVFILSAENYSEDFITNRQRLASFKKIKVKEIKSSKDFPEIKSSNDTEEESPVIIDALFGSGLSRPLSGLAAELVSYLNVQSAHRVSIDIPGGLYADRPAEGVSFHADHTITFQHPKLSFLFTDNYSSVGQWQTVDIGLNKSFIASLPCPNFIVEKEHIQKIISPRNKFDHKGKFGHAFIHAGNVGKMGAALLCAKACAVTGAGLTTAHIPENQSAAMNVFVPEVMTAEYEKGKQVKNVLPKANAVAFGPGIGTSNSAKKTFFALLDQIKSPVVLDADALNILSEERNFFKRIPKNSILTPHPKEFERIASRTSNWLERLELQRSLSAKHSVYIILKGANTCITSPEGNAYFNTTGNAGMAKGGSGDVLTGMIVSLLAQNYSPFESSIAAVYLHGLAADIAVKKTSLHSLLAGDIIENIGKAFEELL